MMKRYLTLAIIALSCTFASFSGESEERLTLAKTAVEATDDAERITVSNQTVTITNNSSNPGIYCVYCVTGQAVKSFRLAPGAHISFELPKGFYVVKCNNERSRKFIVR